ncbi:MAG: hypothetical protein NXI01_06790 [Gammaproteobacteria bacterium]|nr:hypothetical protein [Gammaproteobacteria bacterium]
MTAFFEYRRDVLRNFDARATQSAAENLPLPSFGERSYSDEAFYKSSFNIRIEAELEYAVLDALSCLKEVPESIKTRADYYLEACARLLEQDANIAENTAEAERYSTKILEQKALRNTIVQQNNPALPNHADRRRFWEELQKGWQQFRADLDYLLSARSRISIVIFLLSYINLYRLLSLFSRFSVKAFWSLASEKTWIDLQDKIWGHKINRAILDTPTELYNILSVALFITRFSAHFAMIAKHARSQKDGERQIPWQKRAWREFYVRMPHMVNDFVWAIMNFVTNYAALLGIAAATATMMLFCTLVFDICWLLTQWYCKEQDWKQEKDGLLAWNEKCTDTEEREFVALQLKILDDLHLQMQVLYLSQVLAGLAIMSSYALVLMMGSALVSSFALVVCVAGFGMYGSANEFSIFMRAQFGKQRLKGEEQAGWEWLSVWAKFTFTPLVLAGAFTLGWPVGVMATLLIAARPYLPPISTCMSTPETVHHEHGLYIETAYGAHLGGA